MWLGKAILECSMGESKRSTIYFDEDIHRALKLKSAEIDSSISELVNEAVALYLNQDAEDLASFDQRKNESSTDFETFVTKLKADGKI